MVTTIFGNLLQWKQKFHKLNIVMWTLKKFDDIIPHEVLPTSKGFFYLPENGNVRYVAVIIAVVL